MRSRVRHPAQTWQEQNPQEEEKKKTLSRYRLYIRSGVVNHMGGMVCFERR